MLNPFAKRDDPHALTVQMTGVKMGERVALVGCGNADRLAAVAHKVGLSGRAVAVMPDQASADAIRKGAERAGVLIEIETAPPTRLGVPDGHGHPIGGRAVGGCRTEAEPPPSGRQTVGILVITVIHP